MPNRLADEKSLYLRQHANNPVQWWPWCEEAWAEARRLDKPVLVSIGYSSCHWCHVMARESFSNAYIASLMNKHFVCIKVDREERPDIDQLFMESVQMITGQGGWPLNAFCLPDGRPFFGGTYFPPEDRNVGIVPWPQLIMRVADHYRKAREELEENATGIFGNLIFSNEPLGMRSGEAPAGLNNRDLVTAAESLCGQYDVQNGGFGGAPKFPPVMSLNFLDTVRGSATADANPSLATRLDTVLTGTLTAMARGGIYDQIGGGFTRYSVDAHWEIPHFEKMLYDNALLIGTYLRGYQRYRDPLYLTVIGETIGWLDAELKAKNAPAYYAALDAETDGKEGIYYLWNREQVQEVLGEADAERFCAAYGISEEGNFEKTGLSNPIWHGKQHALREELEPLRQKLLAARRKRTAPGCDNKVLTGWNALLATSLTEAGFWLGRSDWLEKARTLLDWLWQTMTFTREDGSLGLYAVYYEDGGARIDAFLDDYAALAQACFTLAGKVDILESGAHAIYIDRANALLAAVNTRFADTDAPGWFFTGTRTANCANAEEAATDATPTDAAAATLGKNVADGHANGCCGDKNAPADGNSHGHNHENCCGGNGETKKTDGDCCSGGHQHSHQDDHTHSGEGCCGGHRDAEETESGCCGGDDGHSHGGCGCSHGHDEPEAVPFTVPAPGQTLLRKKYWLDNATPCGISLLAHAFGAQQVLSDEQAPDAATIIACLRPAYSGLAARAPGAIANVLTAFTAQAVGLPVIKTDGGATDARELQAALADRPWRSLFILATDATATTESGDHTTGSGLRFQLCIGMQCLPAASASAVAAQI